MPIKKAGTAPYPDTCELRAGDFPAGAAQSWSLGAGGKAASSRVLLQFALQQNSLSRNKLPQQGGPWRNGTGVELDARLYFWNGVEKKKREIEERGGRHCCACSLSVIWSTLLAGATTPSVTDLLLLCHASLLAACGGAGLENAPAEDPSGAAEGNPAIPFPHRRHNPLSAVRQELCLQEQSCQELRSAQGSALRCYTRPSTRSQPCPARSAPLAAEPVNPAARYEGRPLPR